MTTLKVFVLGCVLSATGCGSADDQSIDDKGDIGKVSSALTAPWMPAGSPAVSGMAKIVSFPNPFTFNTAAGLCRSQPCSFTSVLGVSGGFQGTATIPASPAACNFSSQTFVGTPGASGTITFTSTGGTATILYAGAACSNNGYLVNGTYTVTAASGAFAPFLGRTAPMVLILYGFTLGNVAEIGLY